jgi:transposase-like protein
MRSVEDHRRYCPNCGSFKGQVLNGKNPSGSPRKKCKQCGKTYTPVKGSNQYPLSLDLVAMWLSHAFSYREVARLLDVAPKTVINAVERNQEGFRITLDLMKEIRSFAPKPFRHLVGGRDWYPFVVFHFPWLKQRHPLGIKHQNTRKTLGTFHSYIRVKEIKLP